MRRWVTTIVALTVCAHVAAAQPPPEAERLYTEGQQAYDAKNYDKALAAWERSYELSKIPALVFNIAQAQRLRGDCAKAVASYKKFVELDPSSGERPDAEGWIKDLEPCPVVKPVDKPIVKPIKKPIETPTGHPGRTKKIIGIGAAATGIVVAATGLYFGNKAKTLANEIKTDCADGGCVWDELRDKDADGRSAEQLQYILLGVGAATVITGGVFYWLGARESSSVTVAPRGDGAVVSWTGKF